MGGLLLVLSHAATLLLDNLLGLISVGRLDVVLDEDGRRRVQLLGLEALLDLEAHLEVGLLAIGGLEVEPAPTLLRLELIHGGENVAERAAGT